MNLGRIGVWTAAFDGVPAARAREAAAQIEDLGYGTIWFVEAFGREAFTQASLLLGATERITVATGIATIYGRDPFTMAQAQRTLTADHDGRFLLGMGVSNKMVVEQVRGHVFGPPVPTMRDYLDRMDASAGAAAEAMGGLSETPETGDSGPRVLAAIGPKMLAFAGERAWGAHTYFVPVEHTRRAREILGEGPLLAVEQAVALGPGAADRARQHVSGYLAGPPHYARNMRDLGYTDLTGDDVVNALVAYGDVEAVAERVHAHLDAGADHVALQVLADGLPLEEWQKLGASIL